MEIEKIIKKKKSLTSEYNKATKEIIDRLKTEKRFKARDFARELGVTERTIYYRLKDYEFTDAQILKLTKLL